MKCPHCNQDIVLFADAGRIGGSAKSEAKSKASRLNGRLGGRPKSVKKKGVINQPIEEPEYKRRECLSDLCNPEDKKEQQHDNE